MRRHLLYKDAVVSFLKAAEDYRTTAKYADFAYDQLMTRRIPFINDTYKNIFREAWEDKVYIIKPSSLWPGLSGRSNELVIVIEEYTPPYPGPRTKEYLLRSEFRKWLMATGRAG